MPEEPSNSVLLEKILSHKELSETKFNSIIAEFQRLNGQVKKNTEFRIKGMLIGSVVLVLVPTAITFLLNKIL